MRGAWLEGGVQMSTKSSGPPSSSPSGESSPRASGRRRWHSARCPGRASAAAAIRTSGRSSQPGRCPWMATLPRPMIPPRRILLEIVLADDGLQGFVEDREPGQSGLFADHEGRVDAHGGRVGHGRQPATQALLVEGLGDVLAERLLGPAILHELDAEQEAAAPDLPHHAVLLLQGLEPLEHDGADPVRVLDEVLFQDDLERGEPRRRGERIAAVARRGRARVRPGLLARQLLRRDHGGERKASAHALAHRHDVGHDLIVVGAPHRARPADARDHLVADQERARLLGDLLDGAEEALGRDDIAGGALDGLDDDGGDLPARLVADDVADVVGAGYAAVGIGETERAAIAVRVRRQVLAGEERPQVMLEVAAEQAEHSARLAVEAAPEADDLALARGRLGEPERGLHGLRAPREHLDAGEAFGGEGGERLEKAGPRLRGEAAEGELFHLALERLYVVRVALADRAYGDTRNEIDVLLPVLVDESGALPPRHGQARVEGEALHAGGGDATLALDDGPGARAGLAAFCHRKDSRKRVARYAPMVGPASSRKRAKLGQAFRSMRTSPPPGVTMQSPP